jgi:hypothetical protein
MDPAFALGMGMGGGGFGEEDQPHPVMEGVVAVADLKAGGLPGAFDFDSAEFGLSSDRDSEGAV